MEVVYYYNTVRESDLLNQNSHGVDYIADKA